MDDLNAEADVGVDFDWAAPGVGQVPSDPNAIFIMDLQPNTWNLRVWAVRDQCFPECGILEDVVSAHITALWRQGTQPGRYVQRFGAPPKAWIPTGGTWNTQSGFHANSANVAFTSSVYTGRALQERYHLSVDLYSDWSAPGNTLGLVLNQRSAGNYYELRFSPAGTVTFSKVVNGVRTALRQVSHAIPPHTFFHVDAHRAGRTFEFRINGAPVMSFLDTSDLFRGGNAGVFASWNNARFDNFVLQQDRSWNDGLLFTFTEGAAGWTAESGTWVAQDGVYSTTTSQKAAISLVNNVGTGAIEAPDYRIDARINLPWSNTGNRGGLVYDYRDARNYRAVLLSPINLRPGAPSGRLELIEVVGGVTHSRATRDTVLHAGQWGPISVTRVDGVTRVTLCHHNPMHACMPTLVLDQPDVRLPVYVGVISSWNLARFDDVVVRTQTPAQ